jgi:probable O-glycosylation ligase (exosortase A-associated)
LRSLIIFLIIFALLPAIIFKPHTGVLVWSWLSYMNPHRLTWGPAFSFPFAFTVGATTIAAWLISREPKRFPLTPVTVLLIVYILWVNVTTIFVLNPEGAYAKREEFMKILAMTFITLCLMVRPNRVQQLVWVIVVSIGIYGVAGGLFIILTGGQYRVYGPEHSFIADNNSLALALIMTLPLMRYLQLNSENLWIRWGTLVALILTLLAVIGTYSRGGFLALGTMVVYLILKSRQRLIFGFAILLLIPVFILLMPDQWAERMMSIRSYEQDASAQARFEAWTVALRLANDHPLFGGGFKVFFSEAVWAHYLPDASRYGRSAHSIYFEVLGEHGYVGLTLFLLIGISAWRSAGWVVKATRRRPNLAWAHDLCSMLQVGLIGYATGGLFLNLATFDLYYHFLAIIVLVRAQVGAALKQEDSAEGRGVQIVAVGPSASQGGSALRDSTVAGRNPSDLM